MCYHLSAVAIAGLLKKKAIHKQPIISGGGFTNVVSIGKSTFHLKFPITNRVKPRFSELCNNTANVNKILQQFFPRTFNLYLMLKNITDKS